MLAFLTYTGMYRNVRNHWTFQNVDQGFGPALLRFIREETPANARVPILCLFPPWDKPMKETGVHDSVLTLNSKNGCGMNKGREHDET